LAQAGSPGEVTVMMVDVELLLWGLAGVVALVVCLPMLLGILGLTRVRNRVDMGGIFELHGGDENDYASFVDQLRALGFRPLGVKHQTARFLGHHWSKSFHTHVFGLSESNCYASVYELMPGDGFRVCLSTIFTDGGMVQTGSTMQSMTIQEGSYFRSG